jgi:hypothetical protein
VNRRLNSVRKANPVRVPLLKEDYSARRVTLSELSTRHRGQDDHSCPATNCPRSERQAAFVLQRKRRASQFQRIASLRIKSGDYAHVKKIDAEKSLITVELITTGKTCTSREITYDPRRVGGSGINLYAEKQREFTAGDHYNQCKSLATGKPRASQPRYRRRRFVDRHGNGRLQLDKADRIIRFNLRNWHHRDYAYSMTSYSVQTNTYTNTFCISTPRIRIT